MRRPSLFVRPLYVFPLWKVARRAILGVLVFIFNYSNQPQSIYMSHCPTAVHLIKSCLGWLFMFPYKDRKHMFLALRTGGSMPAFVSVSSVCMTKYTLSTVRLKFVYAHANKDIFSFTINYHFFFFFLFALYFLSILYTNKI